MVARISTRKKERHRDRNDRWDYLNLVQIMKLLSIEVYRKCCAINDKKITHILNVGKWLEYFEDPAV